ncbi:SemiSWEET transporter [Candidatus Woesearchaeota archaeon]|nr:SemiSWEET transporter [Candidatus Woesearchaeota archaeon]
MITFWELWGIIAGMITASSFIPQIAKGYKTKRLDDLSYYLNVFFMLGLSMWLVYGIVVGSIAIIVANILGLAFNGILIFMKYKYQPKV